MLAQFTGRSSPSCVLWCCPQHDNTMTTLTLNTRTDEQLTTQVKQAFPPFGPKKIFVRIWVTFGHLRNHLAAVPLLPHTLHLTVLSAQSISPVGPQEILVRIQVALGQLRNHLADVPLQPLSPLDSSALSHHLQPPQPPQPSTPPPTPPPPVETERRTTSQCQDCAICAHAAFHRSCRRFSGSI